MSFINSSKIHKDPGISAHPPQAYVICDNLILSFQKHADFKNLYDAGLKGRLIKFGHEVTFDPQTHEPYLLLNGEKTRWSDIKAEIAKDLGRSDLSFNGIPHGWSYNEKGFNKKNETKWTKLTPDWKDDSPDARAGRYFVELMCEKGFFSHCWLRLIDNEQNVISVGLWGQTHKFLPLRHEKGTLFSPDKSEFRGNPITATRINIDWEDYETLVNKIERDQSNPASYLKFNIRTRNCAAYACECLREIGIDINNREFIAQTLTRKYTKKIGLQIPIPMQKVVDAIAHIFRITLTPVQRLLFWFLGAHYVDKSQKRAEKDAKQNNIPLIPTPKRSVMERIKDFFEGKHLSFTTGWKTNTWQHALEKYRQKEVKKIEQEMAAYENIGFLSDEMRKQYEEKIFIAKYRMPKNEVKATPLGFVAAA